MQRHAWTGAYAINRPYTTNGLNQYTQAGTAAFAYDPNGNLTSDGSTAFTYDVENRLVAASGARTASLRYDPLGRLYEVTGASGTMRFLYDGDALVAEYDTAGVRQQLYVHATGADTPFIWFTPTDIRFLHTDQQGSIVAVSSIVTGTVVAVNSYDEYGIPAAGNVGRFQYTGQAWLPELGMYYYKARIYSPTLGRFLQTDPVGYQDQYNLYAYVGNDPVNRGDPSGRYRVVYGGPDSERARAMVREVADSDPELAARLTTMENSRHVHLVELVPGSSYSANIVAPTLSVGEFNLSSVPSIETAIANSINGTGTSSVTQIGLEPTTVSSPGSPGGKVISTPQTRIAHEVFEHAWRRDTGTELLGTNPRTGVDWAEEAAVNTENRYRVPKGLPPRIGY